MLRAAFVTEYDAHLAPEGDSDTKEPSELETLTIVFLVLFSMRGRYTCAMSAGAATFVLKTFVHPWTFIVNGVSIAWFCARSLVSTWPYTGEEDGDGNVRRQRC